MQKILRKKLPGGKFHDVPEVRSKTMRAIRSRDNRSTEARFRALLVQAGVRGWTMHPEAVPGTPEFFFAKERIAVFTDGCFWHGCPLCDMAPKANRAYWKKKIELNRERDAKDDQQLFKAGIRVLRIWEHDLRSTPQPLLHRLLRMLGRRMEPYSASSK